MEDEGIFLRPTLRSTSVRSATIVIAQKLSLLSSLLAILL